MAKILLDVHTHTVASGHAYSTLQEMVAAAAQKGIEVLGITEHGPSIPGTCRPIYFNNLHCVPRHIDGVHLLLGCEINILNTNGEIDLDDHIMERLDIRIAGIHRLCWEPGTREENTSGVVKVMRDPRIHIISHPGDGTAELDFPTLVKVSKESHTLLEINNHSLAPIRQMNGAKENNLEILRLCKDMDVPVILGSDAHISYMIGDYERLYPLLDAVQFPERLIMNYWPDKFFNYLGITKNNK
ncbi:MAG: phosphatase [Prevotella sp.]|jgi:putative hydrolase